MSESFSIRDAVPRQLASGFATRGRETEARLQAGFIQAARAEFWEAERAALLERPRGDSERRLLRESMSISFRSDIAAIKREVLRSIIADAKREECRRVRIGWERRIIGPAANRPCEITKEILIRRER